MFDPLIRLIEALPEIKKLLIFPIQIINSRFILRQFLKYFMLFSFETLNGQRFGNPKYKINYTSKTIL